MKTDGQAAIETILLIPAIMFVLLLMVNTALVICNQVVVIDAATNGARTASAFWNDERHKSDLKKLCREEAEKFLAQRLVNADAGRVEIKRSGRFVEFTVSCSFRPVFPGFILLDNDGIMLQHKAVYFLENREQGPENRRKH